ncbi:MAG: STAS domain-containing protein [Elusimicrobiales bacterium]|nr:STAS domain-containing protein [Elusimicrobiales bacterium]
MIIEKEAKDEELILNLKGRLDTSTSPQLDEELKKSLSGVKSLILNLKELEYLSSAGLRIILSAQKTMNRQGKMKICNVNDAIMEVFDMTGFADILTIE